MAYSTKRRGRAGRRSFKSKKGFRRAKKMKRAVKRVIKGVIARRIGRRL